MKLLYLGLACTALSGASYENVLPGDLTRSVGTVTPQNQRLGGSPLPAFIDLNKITSKPGGPFVDLENDPTIAHVQSQESLVDKDEAGEENQENEAK